MSQFVKIVRPFQLNVQTIPRLVVDPNATPKDNVVWEVGKSGTPQTVSGNISYTWHGYMKKRVKERRKPQGATGP